MGFIKFSKNGLYELIPFLFLTLIFLILTLFILNCFAEQLLFKRTLSRMTKSKISLEKSKDFTQNVEKTAKLVERKKFDEVKTRAL